jgi:molybdopterin-guanine dinucleotide biosynthesis protein A
MGIDKAMIEIGGRPLALRVADRLALCCGSVSLVGDPARYGALGLPVIPDTFPGEGPLAGIEAALGATASDRNLIAACDMPELDSDVMELLFAATAQGPPDAAPEIGTTRSAAFGGGTCAASSKAHADCAVPQYDDGRIEPLCAVYHRRCRQAVRAALEAGVRRVTETLRRLEAGGYAIRYVRVASEAPFANLNTPDEMRRYLNG